MPSPLWDLADIIRPKQKLYFPELLLCRIHFPLATCCGLFSWSSKEDCLWYLQNSVLKFPTASTHWLILAQLRCLHLWAGWRWGGWFFFDQWTPRVLVITVVVNYSRLYFKTTTCDSWTLWCTGAVKRSGKAVTDPSASINRAWFSSVLGMRKATSSCFYWKFFISCRDYFQSMCPQPWAYSQESCWTILYDISPVNCCYLEGFCFLIFGLLYIPTFLLPSAVLLVGLSPLKFSLTLITTYGAFQFIAIRGPEDNSHSVYSLSSWDSFWTLILHHVLKFSSLNKGE